LKRTQWTTTYVEIRRRLLTAIYQSVVKSILCDFSNTSAILNLHGNIFYYPQFLSKLWADLSCSDTIFLQGLETYLTHKPL